MSIFKTHIEFTAQHSTISALYSLLNSLESTQKSPSDILPIAILMAFSIESYINNIGASQIRIWDEIERLPWKRKLIILHKERKKNPEWEHDPLQFATEIFKLRDRLAHGKPESIEGPSFASRQEALDFIQNNDIVPEWFSKIDEAWVQKTQKRFDELMEYLSLFFGSSPTNYFQTSTIHITSPHTSVKK
jgi:hypothetical protein